eukprot:1008111-Pyramimonas_sp.AAC.1
MANRTICHCHLSLAYPATALWHGIAQHGSPKSGDPYVCGVLTYRPMPIPPLYYGKQAYLSLSLEFSLSRYCSIAWHSTTWVTKKW